MARLTGEETRDNNDYTKQQSVGLAAEPATPVRSKTPDQESSNSAQGSHAVAPESDNPSSTSDQQATSARKRR